MKLSDRIESIEASRTVRFTTLIKRMRENGKDVIDFAVGEPHYDTPQPIIEATQVALEAKRTRYGPVAGETELRRNLAMQFGGCDQDHILVSNGSKQVLFSVFQIICNPLDEVIIPRPYWVSFSQQVRLAGAKPVFVDTIEHQLDCEGIRQAVTSRTRAILVNSPNNPTGAVYPETDLKKIAEIAETCGLYVVSDEAYDQFVYDGIRFHSIREFPEIGDRVIVVRSFSKSYSMTGFRVGYVSAPKAIIAALEKLQSHTTGNVCTFAQYGALQALHLGEYFLAHRRLELQRKRDIAFGYAAELFDCVKPRGAFYLFPSIRRHLNPGEDAEGFASRILERSGVAVVPGEAFGSVDHIRISYAVSENTLEEGFKRMAEAL